MNEQLEQQIEVLKTKDRFKRQMYSKGFKWVGIWLTQENLDKLEEAKQLSSKDYDLLNDKLTFSLKICIDGIKRSLDEKASKQRGNNLESIADAGVSHE